MSVRVGVVSGDSIRRRRVGEWDLERQRYERVEK